MSLYDYQKTELKNFVNSANYLPIYVTVSTLGLFHNRNINSAAQCKQGKSEGFDSCDRPSNLTQTGFKSSIFQPVWPWNLMDDPEK